MADRTESAVEHIKRLEAELAAAKADMRKMRANFVHALTCITFGCSRCLELREAVS